jgi:RAT1-interacting protein
MADLFEEEEISDDFDCVRDYGRVEYWEERYKHNAGSFDWYMAWDRLSREIQGHYSGSDRVLVIGCGNSMIPIDMLSAGFPEIVSIDISETVISRLKEKYVEENRLKWLKMNCSSMSFENEEFDLVIEKGTFDAIVCGADALEIIDSTMKEIFRVLRNRGRFILVTLGSPSQRFALIRRTRFDWHVYPPLLVTSEIENTDCNYIYIFEKRV